MRSIRNAFTLIELLVVIGIIAILGALVIGPTKNLLLRSSQAKCANNLRQLFSATIQYTTDSDGKLPMTGAGQFNTPPWYNPLTPYLGTAMKTGSSIALDPAKASINKVFQCPGYTGTPREVTYAPSITWANGNIRSLPKTSQKIWLTTSTDSYSVNPSGQQRFNFPYSGNKAQVVFFDGHVEVLSLIELQVKGTFPFNFLEQ